MPTLHDFQQALVADIDRAWADGARVVMPVLPTGGGKCLGYGTPVLMHDGTIKPVQDVRVGDLLMGPDSGPRRVLSLSRGRELLYRVTPAKGDPYVVNASHILSLRRTAEHAMPRYPSQRRAGEILNIPVGEYVTKSKTFRHIHKGWRVGVDYPEKPLPAALPPYLLGVWLGDGTSRAPEVTTVDPEIVEYLSGHAARIGLRLVKKTCKGRTPVYALSGPPTGKGPSKNPVRAALNRYNLLRNKHVPHDYLAGSRAQRLSILAGLMDTDGSYTGRGFDFISVLEPLADAVIYLSRSVGLAAYKSPCRKTCVNNGVEGAYFRVSISGAVDQIPCLIARKKAAPRAQKKDVLNVGITVAPIGEGDYYGFTITGDRLFVLGDFTVTHNTVCLAHILHKHEGAACAIAHRQELVGQISVALAREGLRHKIIAPDSVARQIVGMHLDEVGTNFVDPNAPCAVAGVDTLIKLDPGTRWLGQVTLWVQDEGHHVLRDNKWGRAARLFHNPNCRGLLPTATPKRADGKGLGREYDGLVDAMVFGPHQRRLIELGFLCDYRLACPESDIRRNLTENDVGASGDFSAAKLKAAAQSSRIVGDVVREYLARAAGKLGVTFASDADTAADIAARYRASGVPAEVITWKTPQLVRAEILRRFRRRELLQLVNVDMFGEGFDLPAIEVVSLARPTESLALFMQQFGRALRTMAGKDYAQIIDHVGAVLRHGLPDKADRMADWTLEPRQRRGGGGGTPMKVCANPTGGPGGIACAQPYLAYQKHCPHCGFAPEPAARGTPEQVEGDIVDLSPEVLARMRGDVEARDLDIELYRAQMAATGLPHVPVMANVKRHAEAQQAQRGLREAMSWWGGLQTSRGLPEADQRRLFWYQFGVDVLTAQALGAADASELHERIAADLATNGIDGAVS